MGSTSISEFRPPAFLHADRSNGMDASRRAQEHKKCLVALYLTGYSEILILTFLAIALLRTTAALRHQYGQFRGKREG
jgi:hypothetical protein